MTSEREANQNEVGLAVGPTAPPRPGRLQFSLAALMRLTFLAACLGALWAMYRDLQQTKADRKRGNQPCVRKTPGGS